MIYNILYNNKIIYKELTEQEVKNVLFQLAEKVADGELESDLINVEEV